jgi:heat shock protein HslJ
VPTISFTADSTSITQGSCTMLRWSAENVQAVWVYPAGQPYTQYPVPGIGTQQVCPQTTTSYEMRVQLTDGSVQFRQVTIQVTAPQNPLANTGWLVSRLGGFGVPLPGTTLSAEFGGVGTFAAFGGCNNYNGTYTVNSNAISIQSLAGTQKLCGEDIDAQEVQYIQSLQAARTYALRNGGSELALFDASGIEILTLSALFATPY